jgi:hypothetical protein
MNFRTELKRIASHNQRTDKGRRVTAATIEVTEDYARRVLGKPRGKYPELQYLSLNLKCVGSKRWRERHRNG